MEKPVQFRLSPISQYLISVLILYSLTLIFFEAFLPINFVMYFFSEVIGPSLYIDEHIFGPLPVFAINTTISCWLLAATGLLFLVSSRLIPNTPSNRRERLFCLSQFFVFAYLGLDDRFCFHEALGYYLHLDDSVILLSVGLFEIFALLCWGKLMQRSKTVLISLFMGGLFFGLSIIVDALVPKGAFLRLCGEDLSKLWGIVFLFSFSWKILTEKISALHTNQSGQDGEYSLSLLKKVSPVFPIHKAG